MASGSEGPSTAGVRGSSDTRSPGATARSCADAGAANIVDTASPTTNDSAVAIVIDVASTLHRVRIGAPAGSPVSRLISSPLFDASLAVGDTLFPCRTADDSCELIT